MLSIPTPIAHHPNSIEVIIAVITWILGWATIHNVTIPRAARHSPSPSFSQD